MPSNVVVAGSMADASRYAFNRGLSPVTYVVTDDDTDFDPRGQKLHIIWYGNRPLRPKVRAWLRFWTWWQRR